jgi:hypothetical protein
MWDKMLLILETVLVIGSIIGLIYVLIKQPKQEITIKTRTLLIAIIVLGLFLIRAHF